MIKNNNFEIETIYKELFAAFKGILSWKWDNRLETALAEFSNHEKDNIQTILKRYFSIVWTSSNSDGMPENVQALDAHLGKLRVGQLLFTSDTNQDNFIFCAWWPWGNGTTTSIRIAPIYSKLSPTEKIKKLQLFKTQFGL